MLSSHSETLAKTISKTSFPPIDFKHKFYDNKSVANSHLQEIEHRHTD